MKKITAWILALTLLLAGCALAEGEPFSIRGGLTWGMTPAEALATELFLEYERRETDWGGFSLRFEDVPVAGVTGGLSMGFRDGRLRFLGYTLSDGAIPLDRLKELLESKYGPEQEMDAPRLARLITALYPKSATTPEEIQADGTVASWWDLGNGTLIVMLYDSDLTILLYIDEAGFMAETEYTTDGL